VAFMVTAEKGTQPVVFGTIRAVPPWRQVFNLSGS
jgi:hypothetical protein